MLTLLAAMLLARLLGAEGYGTYAYVLALISLLSIPAEFGFPTLALRETARGVATSDYGNVRAVWLWASRAVALLSIVLLGVAALFNWFWWDHFRALSSATFAYALLLVPLVALGNLRGAALRGLHQSTIGLLPENLWRPGVFLILLGIAWLGGSKLAPPDVMKLEVAAAATAFAFGAFMLAKATPPAIRSATPVFHSAEWARAVVPLALLGGMQLISRNADILLLGIFVTADQIGIYKVALQVASLASFGLSAINLAVAPRFASLHARGEQAQLQRLAVTSARATLAFNVLVTVVFIVFGKWLLALFFGSGFAAAYVPMLILLAGQAVNSAAGSVGYLLNMTGHEKKVARAFAIAAGLNLVLNALLIPYLGIAGAAAASAVSLAAWNVLLWRDVRLHLRINSSAFGRVGIAS